MSISRENNKPTTQLPSWLFDIDDEDEEINSHTSILQELEIDLSQIYRIISWMLFVPFLKMIRRPHKRHPLQISTNIGFWGPCSIVLLYSIMLWLSRIRDAPWTFVIWSVAATINHLVSRVWYRSTLMFHVALLGYSITPILPFAAIILFLRPPVWLGTILEGMAILWSAVSAIVSYTAIMTVTVEQKTKLRLLYPIAILMQMYLLSLMPMARRS